MRCLRAAALAAASSGLAACSLLVSTSDLSGGAPRADASPADAPAVEDVRVPDVGDGAVNDASSDGDAGPTDSGPMDSGPTVEPGDGGPGCPSVIDPSLLLHYTFDEGAGTSLVDCSSHHFDVSVHGKTTWAASRVGSHALGFDGTSTCIELPASPLLELAGKPFTVATWISISVFDLGGNSGRYIFSKTTSSGKVGFRMATDTSDSLNFNVGQTTGSSTGVSVSSVSAGKWLHVAVTIDPTTTTASLYVDGALEKSRATMPGIIEDTTINAHIGCRSDSASWLASTLDDFRLYDRVLTLEEIGALAR